jgi:uncharacterized membrane protein YobD (UPF0266 family)
MKVQDVLFFLILGFFIYKRNPQWAAGTGLFFLLLAMPLFAKWIFFTAERLVWYAAGLFLLSIFIYAKKYSR